MRAAKIILGSILFLMLIAPGNYAQEFTLTTTAANIISSRALIEIPGLSGNPLAIIVATPIGDTQRLNPHSIAAWYYNNKWNIFNADQAVMPHGARYKVQVFLKPDASHFLHVVTKDNLGEGGSYIDSPALNRNPTAQVTIFQNHAPDNRPYSFNRFEAKAEYDSATGKWFIKNFNGNPLYPNTAYNVVVLAGGLAVPTKTPPTASVVLDPPASPSSSSAARKPTPAALMTPAPLPKYPQPVAQNFDNLNEFASKGLPVPAALPDGTVDEVAAEMAKQILKSDNRSLPVLLTALQAAGFTVRDESGKTVLRPADGKGQGLVFFDFEAVGSIKLARAGVGVSLEKLASSMTKDVPQITALEFADLMLSDLRSNADSDNAYVRFMAQLIIQLSNVPGQPNGLLNAPASRVVLSPLQASLMIRRLQGDLFAVRSNLGRIGVNGMRFGARGGFVSAFWEADPLTPFRFASYSNATEGWCNMTADAALFADAGAIALTTAHGGLLTFLSRAFKTGAFEKLGSRIGYANIVLAWAKLIASVKALKGEITVERPLPLKRTPNSVPGERRLMTARIWNEIGKKDAINCFRQVINGFTGLDFSLPQDGAVGDVATEWHFVGANDTPVGSLKFVHFEAPKDAKDPKPNKQVTDKDGLSKMWLVGSPKKPPVVMMKKPIEIEKQAKVMVGVTLKSAKDLAQNLIDFAGAGIGVWTGGPISLIGAAPEILYRLPWVAARTTVPVTDHEPSNAGWRVDFEITVKGKGERKLAQDGSDVKKWVIDRVYKGTFKLNRMENGLQDPEKIRELSGNELVKAMTGNRFTTITSVPVKGEPNYGTVKVPLTVIINDKHDRLLKENDEGDSFENSDDSTVWTANFTTLGMDGPILTFDSEPLSYNLRIPFSFDNSLSPGVVMVTKTITDRSDFGYGDAPTHEETKPEVKSRELMYFKLPDVAGLITNNTIRHKPYLPLFPDFLNGWEFDSGELQPDEPFVPEWPESKTKVKVRVQYTVSPSWMD